MVIVKRQNQTLIAQTKACQFLTKSSYKFSCQEQVLCTVLDNDLFYQKRYDIFKCNQTFELLQVADFLVEKMLLLMYSLFQNKTNSLFQNKTKMPMSLARLNIKTVLCQSTLSANCKNRLRFNDDLHEGLIVHTKRYMYWTMLNN